MNKNWIYIILIAFIAGLTFFISNEKLKGYLGSETALAKEVKSPRDSVYQYKIASQAPFKYRLLFPAIIKSSYQGVYQNQSVTGFYYTYRFWSLLFYISSALAMFWLLKACGFSEGYSFAGSLIFIFLPAMLVAFSLPVHTREDTLAYTLFFVGLIFLVKQHRFAFLVVAMLGALTRETLLLLPLLYFFFGKDPNLLRRFFIAGLPGLLWISIRFLMGREQYDVWEGLRWNLNNPEQVVGFLFVTFNVCWITFVIHLFFYKESIASASSPAVQFFYRSSVFTLSIILITTFVGGIYNEIRLLYLFCPWIIVIFIEFVRNNIQSVQHSITTKLYWLYAFICLGFCSAVLYLVISHRENLIEPGKYNVPYQQWIILTVFYFFLFLLFLPVSIRVLTLKKTAK